MKYDLFFLEKEISDGVNKILEMDAKELLEQAKIFQDHYIWQVLVTKRIISTVTLSDADAADLCKNAFDPKLRKYAAKFLSDKM